MSNTYENLKNSTSICTMGCETLADHNKYTQSLKKAAQMVDCGLITFDEGKRLVFDNS